MKNILILLTLILLSSCSLFSQTNDNSTIEDYKREIIGTWIHENDSLTKLVFSNDNKISHYEGTQLRFTENYEITRTCDGETIPNNKEYFLKTYSDKYGEFCVYIEGLNYENNGLMSIMTKIQGKIVVYKKQ